MAVYTAGPQVACSMDGRKSKEWFSEACIREREEKERERGERERQMELREKEQRVEQEQKRFEEQQQLRIRLGSKSRRE